MCKLFFCAENKLIRYNTGISVIRLVMSFIVVKDHFTVNGNTVTQQLANKLGALAVPCFVFISFYLAAEKLDNNNSDFLKKRLIRLEGPVIGWTIIYYLLFSLCRKGWQDWKHIIYGIIYGSSSILNPPLWFISSQIIVLAGIAILYYMFPDEKQRKKLLFILFILAFFLQYTGVNEYLYSGAPSESRFSLGRVAEIIPIAVSGIFYCKYENVINGKKYGKAITNCLLLIFAAIGSFFPEPGGVWL